MEISGSTCESSQPHKTPSPWSWLYYLSRTDPISSKAGPSIPVLILHTVWLIIWMQVMQWVFFLLNRYLRVSFGVLFFRQAQDSHMSTLQETLSWLWILRITLAETEKVSESRPTPNMIRASGSWMPYTCLQVHIYSSRHFVTFTDKAFTGCGSWPWVPML